MKKRVDSFFGIHFDFHAVECQIVGEDYRPEVVAELLDKVKPDYVQCDTKGHFGYSSYPTKVGTQATEIRHDVLKMWRDLTKERDIALFGHHSGLFDMAAAQLHPDWAVVDEDGNISTEYLSPFGPYADEYLIPQLKELALDYDLNGAWIDGECWGAFVDYSKHATDAYKSEYGKNPPKSCDADYEEYRSFCRKGFEKYVAHYIDELKKVKPEFEITSNWIYSFYMPEKATVNVDFLSGDYSSSNAVESARYHSRLFACRDIPWDLMAWGQNAIPESYETHNRTTKEYEQYCQEAAMTISVGGGFEFFNIMYGGGGTVQPWAIPVWSNVAKFVRERQFCHKAEQIPQVALIYPIETSPHDDTQLYSPVMRSTADFRAINSCLLDCGFSVGAILESDLSYIDKYPFVYLPYAKDFKETDTLIEYVKNGGQLLVDLESIRYFENALNLHCGEKKTELMWFEGTNALAAAETSYADISGDFDVASYVYKTNYFTDNKKPAAVNVKVGKGSITLLAMDFAQVYRTNISTAIKDFMRNIILGTGFEPLVTISGSSYAELNVTKKDDKMLINITNTAGDSKIKSVRAYNEVPKIGPVKVRAKVDEPKKITRMPENTNIDFIYRNGYAEFELETVHIHTVAVVEWR